VEIYCFKDLLETICRVKLCEKKLHFLTDYHIIRTDHKTSRNLFYHYEKMSNRFHKDETELIDYIS